TRSAMCRWKTSMPRPSRKRKRSSGKYFCVKGKARKLIEQLAVHSQRLYSGLDKSQIHHFAYIDFGLDQPFLKIPVLVSLNFFETYLAVGHVSPPPQPKLKYFSISGGLIFRDNIDDPIKGLFFFDGSVIKIPLPLKKTRHEFFRYGWTVTDEGV